jgi:hypothetical protein
MGVHETLTSGAFGLLVNLKLNKVDMENTKQQHHVEDEHIEDAEL